MATATWNKFPTVYELRTEIENSSSPYTSYAVDHRNARGAHRNRNDQLQEVVSSVQKSFIIFEKTSKLNVKSSDFESLRKFGKSVRGKFYDKQQERIVQIQRGYQKLETRIREFVSELAELQGDLGGSENIASKALEKIQKELQKPLNKLAEEHQSQFFHPLGFFTRETSSLTSKLEEIAKRQDRKGDKSDKATIVLEQPRELQSQEFNSLETRVADLEKISGPNFPENVPYSDLWRAMQGLHGKMELTNAARKHTDRMKNIYTRTNAILQQMDILQSHLPFYYSPKIGDRWLFWMKMSTEQLKELAIEREVSRVEGTKHEIALKLLKQEGFHTKLKSHEVSGLELKCTDEVKQAFKTIEIENGIVMKSKLEHKQIKINAGMKILGIGKEDRNGVFQGVNVEGMNSKQILEIVENADKDDEIRFMDEAFNTFYLLMIEAQMRQKAGILNQIPLIINRILNLQEVHMEQSDLVERISTVQNQHEQLDQIVSDLGHRMETFMENLERNNQLIQANFDSLSERIDRISASV